MDRRESFAIQFDIAWTIKHGKDKDKNRLFNRLMSWLWDDEDE